MKIKSLIIADFFPFTQQARKRKREKKETVVSIWNKGGVKILMDAAGKSFGTQGLGHFFSQ